MVFPFLQSNLPNVEKIKGETNKKTKGKKKTSTVEEVVGTSAAEETKFPVVDIEVTNELLDSIRKAIWSMKHWVLTFSQEDAKELLEEIGKDQIEAINAIQKFLTTAEPDIDDVDMFKEFLNYKGLCDDLSQLVCIVQLIAEREDVAEDSEEYVEFLETFGQSTIKITPRVATGSSLREILEPNLS